MTNILNEICDKKRAHVEIRKSLISESELLLRARHAAPTRGFHRALQEKAAQKNIGLIAEVKKASPSRGLIRADFDPAAIARAYTTAGATCISVLTDEPYFQGHDDYLEAVRTITPLPVLRKDFMVDTYQIVESRALGADCILLIMAALTDAEAIDLEDTAHALGMDILVEVHDEHEMERALSILKTRLVGINNRNLKTMAVDTGTTLNLAPMAPADYTLVCESGIHTHADIQQFQAKNIHCFLVGESLMKQADITAATRALLGLTP